MTVYLFAAVIFLLGASLGSFLNAAALRVVAGEQFLRGRSACPHCRKSLRWFELIPLFSFLALRGRCRRCRELISPRYFLVELGMGAYVVALANYFIFSAPGVPPFPFISAYFGAGAPYFNAFVYLAVGALATVIFLIDYDTKLIAVSPLRLAALVGVALLAAESLVGSGGTVPQIFSSLPFSQFLLALAAALFFGLAWLVTRGQGMGLGDAELAGALALFLPYPGAIIMLLAAFWIGAAWGLGLMLFAGYGRKSRIPFGPFIILGFAVALFWGQFLLPYLVPLI